MGDRWDRIPADAFMEILRRLPPSPRRRLRLVCRHWRSVIDDRTPATQARATVLAFVNGNYGSPRAYVLDDITEHGTGGRELELPHGAASPAVRMVGTCNGLLCLRRYRGDFLIFNPVTGEKLAVPPPSQSQGWEVAAYSFVYHPATGLYKIVYVPYDDAVKVFTLGDRSWREVPVPVGTKCLSRFGLASVHGTTYWVAEDAHLVNSIMSLDLKDERFAFVAMLPVSREPWRDHSWHLTDLHGRLALAAVSYERDSRRLKGVQTTEMWMLNDGGRGKKRSAWVLWYKVVEPGQEPRHGVAWPHASHDQYLLTTRASRSNGVSLHASHMSKMRKKRGLHGGLLVQTEGSPSIGLYNDCNLVRTFSYVETTEPLSFYGCSDYDIGDGEEWEWRFDSVERQWKLMEHTSQCYPGR